MNTTPDTNQDHRWSVTAMGNGASVSRTVYATSKPEAIEAGRIRFVEVYNFQPTLVMADDLGPGTAPTAPFEFVGFALVGGA